MSTICLCIVDHVGYNEKKLYAQQLETLAKLHNRKVKFSVDWVEPLTQKMPRDSFVVSVFDDPLSDNCEMLLLPDGWWHNGKTNNLTFQERMTFLYDLCRTFTDNKYYVDLYLCQSGMEPEDCINVALNIFDLKDYLSKTVGIVGVDCGWHIRVHANRPLVPQDITIYDCR